MCKTKMERRPDTNLDAAFALLREKYQGEQINLEDGLKIDFARGWVHLRPSNTEPIIRVYAESDTPEVAEALANQIIRDLS